ncbi:MAG: hypothetical protein ACJ8J0_17485 [Longimicrobiaceae bacterium]
MLGAACAGGDGADPIDISPPAEVVGAPFREVPPYARNVWDMQRFGGRIYLAHGDEIGNRGPVALWTLDPASGRLAAGFTADEEEVESFRVLDGALYAPGFDPRSGWSLGTFYRLERTGWARHRTLPHALHTFDLAWYAGRLFAATGGRGRPGEATLLASADRGRTWTPVSEQTQRIYTLVELGGELYAAPKLRTDGDTARALLRFDGARFRGTGVTGATLLPGLPDTAGRMVHPTGFRGALVYVVAAGAIDWKPAALAVTRRLGDARAVALPDPGAVPYDLLVRGDTLYALTSAPADSGYVVRGYATNDLESWREIFSFRSPAFARSFEETGGDFYIGLGCTYPRPSPASGVILRVRRSR